MRPKNVVTVGFSQDLNYVTNGNPAKNVPGKLIEFSNEASFESETLREISAENIAAFAIGSVENFIAVQRLQGKEGFKMNKPIVFKLKVNNNQTETFEMKMSLSIPRLQKLLEKSPHLIARAFAKFDNVADRTIANEMSHIARMRTGHLIVAKAVKELPAPDNNTEVVVVPNAE